MALIAALISALGSRRKGPLTDATRDAQIQRRGTLIQGMRGEVVFPRRPQSIWRRADHTLSLRCCENVHVGYVVRPGSGCGAGPAFEAPYVRRHSAVYFAKFYENTEEPTGNIVLY